MFSSAHGIFPIHTSIVIDCRGTKLPNIFDYSAPLGDLNNRPRRSWTRTERLSYHYLQNISTIKIIEINIEQKILLIEASASHEHN